MDPKTPTTLLDLDERQAKRMADLAAMLRDEANKRDAEFNKKLAAVLEQKFAAATGKPAQYVSPTGAVSMSSPPAANPGNPSDLLIPMRPRAPSIPGETDDDRIARIERGAKEENAQNTARYGSLAAGFEALREEMRAGRAAAPAVARQAATAAAEGAATAATAAAKSELTTVLTNRNFTGMVIAGITVIGGIMGAGAYAGHQAKQGSKEATTEQAATIEHAAREGAKEAKQDAPTVFVVTGSSVEPAASGKTAPKKKE